MQVERLDRGTVAVRKGDGYLVSWRLLGDETYSTGFNLYRGSAKLNPEPLTTTCFLDSIAPLNSVYFLRPVVDGNEGQDDKMATLVNTTAGSNAAFFEIKLNRPGYGPNGGSYSPGDASAGDLNGDGEYDLVLKWDPSNAQDNSKSGITDNVYLDGYTLKGVQLWRIDLGPNIRAGAHYTQFLVYDFDGNGRAEIMVKTAPGTKDASGKYLSKGPAQSANHTAIYRNSSGYILSGPEYLTVFDGETGLELETVEYWPLRGTVSDWGDSYGNRVDRFNAAVAYVDGNLPSAVFERGYYSRLTMVAWDWRNGKLTRRWIFDSNTSGNGAYFGQGNHSLQVIDANGDGLHDLLTGSSVVSGTGAGLFTSGIGHGDACHATCMKKGEARPMVYMPHENKDGVTGLGAILRFADNGEVVFSKNAVGDVGRGCAAELDSQIPGFHFWAAGMGLYNLSGQIVGAIPSSCNFVIWWDGDLSRELMNSNTVTKWNIGTNSGTALFTGTGAGSINGTKSTPVLQADLLGDWREEVILSRDDNSALRVYVTSMSTSYKLYSLMHDPIYRVAVSWQNSSYNQPPHPGYYLASDMDFPPALPHVKVLTGLYRGFGDLVSDLIVDDLPNSPKWSVASDLQKSKSVFGDKTVFASGLPVDLLGKEWIKTSTESRKWTGSDTLAVFKVKADAVVSVLYNEELAGIPAWLASYSKRDEKVVVSSAISAARTMSIFEKKVTAGEKIILGKNTSDGNSQVQMYFVVVRPADGVVAQKVSNSGNDIRIYPNPVDGLSTIEYRLDEPGWVSIGLYDTYGRLLRRIEESAKPQGLNYTSVDGSHLPAGLYLIRVKSGNIQRQIKMVVRK